MADSKETYELTPLSVENLKELRDLYRANWPENCVHFYCLNNFIGWLEKLKHMDNLQLFSLNNNWRETGIYLIRDRYQLFLGAFNESWNPLLEKALELVPWQNGIKLSSVQKRHRDPVMKVIEKKQLKLEYESFTVMYYLPKEKAVSLEVKCPKGFEIRPLAEEDASTINDLWPNKHIGSLFFIRRQIQLSINVGLYHTETQELVAWCIRLQGGFAGALQVKDSYKRQGFGTLILSAFAKAIGDSGDDVIALVNKDNYPSRKTCEKVGFQIIDGCYWIRNYPTPEGSEWPDNM